MEDDEFRSDVPGQEKVTFPEQCDNNNAIESKNHGKDNENGKLDYISNDENRDGAEEVGIKDNSDNPQGDADDTKDETVPKGRYQGLPSNLLHCSLCNKSMWDADSFQKHVDGKAHRQMIRSVEYGFRVDVKFLRTQACFLEVNKTIEIERKKHNIENYRSPNQEETTHCNMCDETFSGINIAHRMSDDHRRLKRFLHPKCNYCLQKFSSRIKWVYHRFTPDHLDNVKQVMNTNEAPIIEDAAEINIDSLLEDVLKPEAGKPILELDEKLKIFYRKLPPYKPTQKVAKENVKPTSGFYCDLCKLFFMDETVAEDHLLTKKHCRAFVKATKRELKERNDKVKDTKEDQNDSEEACQVNVTSSDKISDNDKITQTDEDKVEGETVAAEDNELPYQEEDNN